MVERMGNRDQLITNMDEKKEVAAVLDIINQNTGDMDWTKITAISLLLLIKIKIYLWSIIIQPSN